MELITYRGVELTPVHTNYIQREPVRSEDRAADYLMTKWTVDVVCAISPGAMSYIVDHAAPVADPDSSPGTTDNAIRSFFAQDRGTLKIIAGGAIILNSPGFNNSGQRYEADAMGTGPKCEVFTISEIIGTQFFRIHLRFVVHVNECKQTSAKILSHRWSITESVDKLFYPTRIIFGKAILRADMMLDLEENADEFRSQFFHPVPNNFQREEIQVALSEDGTELTYSFKDVGKCFNFGAASPIVDAKIHQSGNYVEGTHIRAQAQHQMWRNLQKAGYNFGTLATGASQSIFSAQLRNLPQYVFTMEVELWGDRNCPRGLLHRIAMGISASQLALNQPGLGVALREISMTHDRLDNHVCVRQTLKWGDDLNQSIGPNGDSIFALVNGGPDGAAGKRTFFKMFDQDNLDDNVTADFSIPIMPTLLPTADQALIVGPGRGQRVIYAQKDSNLTANPRLKKNPLPPFGSRSTLITDLVQQSLKEPCTPPELPDSDVTTIKGSRPNVRLSGNNQLTVPNDT